MSPKRRKEVDPLERAIEEVLCPGTFISYNAAGRFMNEVQRIAEDIEKMIEQEPQRAVHLCELFIAACHEKAEEIDDSNGDFGMLVEDLFRGWIQARQALKADANDTAKALLSWMEDDPYGLSHDLDRVAVEVLDEQGLDALMRQVRARFDAAPALDEKEKNTGAYTRRRWRNVLKTLLAGLRDVESYIAVCEQTGIEPKDCKIIAELYRSRKRPEAALSWVERGLEVKRAEKKKSFEAPELPGIRRTLLAKLKRSDEALQSAWSEFQDYPSPYTYKELMRFVPAKEKTAWHQKAMEASEKADLTTQIDLWLEKKEIERLAARVRKATDEELEACSHFSTEPLARKLERLDPEISARVYRALCMRIVNAGKSKYYHAALDHIRRAKKCYVKAGRDAEWQAVIADVRERHSRKAGFMPGFENIVSGKRNKVTPPFLDRAKLRWSKKTTKK